MRKLLTIAGICWSLLGLAWGQNWAGAQIRFDRPSDSVVRVELTQFLLCSDSVVAPPDPTISNGCGAAAPTALTPWLRLDSSRLEILCDQLVTDCRGTGTTVAPGHVAVRYARDYRLPLDPCPGGYRFALRQCCRIDSLDNGLGGSFGYQFAEFDPTVRANRAPTPLYPGPIYLTDSTTARVALTANDADGDSLAYRLVAALDTAGQTAAYNPNFGATTPLGGGWGVSLDPVSGLLQIDPTTGTDAGKSVRATLGLEIREFRNGVEIGRYYWENELTVLDLPNPANDSLPALNLDLLEDSLWGGTANLPVVEAASGERLTLRLNATDNGTDVSRITWSENLSGALFEDFADPTRKLDTVEGVNPTAEVKWLPRRNGQFSFAVRLIDLSQCATLRQREYSLVLAIRDTALLVGLPGDTLICPGDTLSVEPELYGSSLPTDILLTWQDGFPGTRREITNPGVYEILAQDTSRKGRRSRENSATMRVGFAPYCVYPGDADNDGVADIYDALAVGLAFGARGPTRPNASLEYTGQAALPWKDTLVGGVDFAHANTNGDTIIDLADTEAILRNYGQTHNKTERNGPLPVYLDEVPEVALAGDTVRLGVYVGNDSISADSIYGLAFTLNYDNRLVDSGSVRVNLVTSWLGTPGVDLFSLQKDRFDAGAIDVAICRNNQVARSGQGQVARLDIILIDDITGKRETRDSLTFRIEGVRVIAPDGSQVPARGSTSVLAVTDSLTGTSPFLPRESLQLYPNPTLSRVRIVSPRLPGASLELYDIQGRLLRKEALSGTHTSWNVATLPAGMYLVRLVSASGSVTRRLLIREAW